MCADALDRAIALHQAHRLAEAEAAYRAILVGDPRHPDALHLLGLLACDRHQPAAALPYLQAALAAAPARAAFHNTHARALAALHHHDAAEAAYRAAWSLQPDSAEIANNLGCLLLAGHRAPDAVAWLHRAAALAPTSAAIAVSLAVALVQASDPAAAAQLAHAAALGPHCATTQRRIGRLHLQSHRPAAAHPHLRTAAALTPDDHPDAPGTHTDLGVTLDRLHRHDEAAQCFRAALRADPDHADAHYNLGCLLLLDGEHAEARRHHARALTIDPLHGRARWALCMAELPPVYDSPAEAAAQRHRYDAALALLEHQAATDPAIRASLAAAIGASQPFFLPYQGEALAGGDLPDVDLQRRYGSLLARLIPPDPTIRLADPPAPGETLRLGIVTGHACEHTLWRLMIRGWLTHLDRTAVTVHLYNTGTTADDQTACARRLADRYRGGSAAALRAAILADRPHILLYPELGIDPVCPRLAAERLAPVQCVAWGHPITSGLPTIDWFLTSDAMEPPDGARHYTERLLRLPGLGVVPMLQDDAPRSTRTRAAFGLRADAVVYWCGQSLPKYAPEHDHVLARIAQAVPAAQFLFIAFARSAVLTARVRDRLSRAFAAHGLDAARLLVFTPPLSQADFHASIRVSDVVLDSIGWSGGKSTLDLLADAPIVVTHEAALMRGRHTAAIMRHAAAAGTIAPSVASYIRAAIDHARTGTGSAG